MGMKSQAKAESYYREDRVCATCGKSTGGLKGYGDWHEKCARDEHGRLLVVDGKAA